MSTIKVNAIQDTSGNYQYTARFWIRYDQTTPTINGSGNVSSITDIGTGNFDVNFTNSLSTSYYAIGEGSNSAQNRLSGTAGEITTAKVRHVCENDSGTNVDSNNVSLMGVI